MRFAFAMNDPPIELASSGPLNIKILGRYAADACVKGFDFRESQLIVSVIMAALEDNRAPCCVVGDEIRAEPRETILPAQERGELAEKRQPLMSVVGLPHRRLQSANLVRLEIPQAMGAGCVKVPRSPGEDDANCCGDEYFGSAREDHV
jgi:hypothetical protein